MTPTPPIVALAPARARAAAAVLALAFQDDPVARHVFPDAVRRAPALRWLFRVQLRDGLRHGRVDTTTAGDGVALWLAPGNTTLTPWRVLRSGALLAPVRWGWGACRRAAAFLKTTTAWQHQHAPEAHWYLAALGVTPARQGHGIGTALLQPVLARADAAGLPCYLETGVARNVGFYARQGFTVVDEGALPQGGPWLWAMRRAPHTP